MSKLSGVTSYSTAIKRSGPSVPLKAVESQLNAKDLILDYGCGRGTDVSYLKAKGYSVCGYDPHWLPTDLSDKSGLFDVVLCTYVLNVLPKSHEDSIISEIKSYLSEGGKAFVAVRRDKFKEGQTPRGFQRMVELNYPVFKSKSGAYCVYEISK
tara:strand:- start:747 stop:1208 length:462 start_codon:yes stop_codon:yes gene_type:complete